MNLTDTLKCSVLCQMSYDGDGDEIAAFLKAPAHTKAVGDVCCIVCDTDPQTVVFRGTDSIGGWLLDFDSVPMYNARFLDGKVHQGFASAFGDLAPWLYEKVIAKREIVRSDHGSSVTGVSITGHSLGGAIATLASQWLYNLKQNVLPVYTFGSPRVGDAAFAAAYKPVQYRVVNDLDPVPHVPVGLGYTHVGEEIRLPEMKPAGIFRTISDLLTHARHGLGATVIEAIKDHGSGNYAATLKAIQDSIPV